MCRVITVKISTNQFRSSLRINISEIIHQFVIKRLMYSDECFCEVNIISGYYAAFTHYHRIGSSMSDELCSAILETTSNTITWTGAVTVLRYTAYRTARGTNRVHEGRVYTKVAWKAIEIVHFFNLPDDPLSRKCLRKSLRKSLHGKILEFIHIRQTFITRQY